MNIKQRVDNLVNKFKTRDPFELAAYLNIEVLKQPMNTRIRGFYDRILKQKFIYINSNLASHEQKQVCAHELGHALLHKGWGYYFIIEHTFYCPGRFEREANEFAWFLLYDEKCCQYEYNGNIYNYVHEEGISELIEYAKK